MPIAYASGSLQPHEKYYGITELEGLGVVWVVKHFRFMVIPVNQPLSTDMTTQHPSALREVGTMGNGYPGARLEDSSSFWAKQFHC